MKLDLLSREQWEELFEALQTARAGRQELPARLDQARLEQKRLIRFRDAAKTMAWRAELKSELEELDRAVLLPTGSAQVRVQHQGAFAMAAEQERHQRAAIARRDAELSAYPDPPAAPRGRRSVP